MVNWEDYIVSTPGVICGKPAIKGTRIGVDLILENLASNYSFEDILSAYPRVTKEAIQACLAFAADSVRYERLYAKAS